MGKIQEIRDLLEESKTNDFAYDLIMERSADYLSHLLSELEERERELELFDQRGERIEQLLDEKESLQQQLDAAKQDIKEIEQNNENLLNRILQHRKALGYVIKSHVPDDPDIKNIIAESLQQQLKQAIEALETIVALYEYAADPEIHMRREAKKALSLLQESSKMYNRTRIGM